MEDLSEEMWQAIFNNDASYDGQFYYAVTTTGIFCRPSCKSRTPLYDHVRVFMNPEEAVHHQFRPCKRCKPEGRKLPDADWIDQAVQLIESRYYESLTLAGLAELIHGSPFHLHRTFKRLRGITPAEYLRKIRISKAQQYLRESGKPVKDIAEAVGIPNAAHFATSFQKETGLTPTQYRLLSETEEGLKGE